MTIHESYVTLDNFNVMWWSCSHSLWNKLYDFRVTCLNVAYLLSIYIIISVPLKIQYYSYGLLAAGVVVVLLISIGCNTCIINYRHRRLQTLLIQQQNLNQIPQSDVGNIHESQSIGNISIVSCKYETINENDMAMRNSKNHEQRIHEQTPNRQLTPLIDQPYLEVIGDEVYSSSDEATVESFSMSNINVKELILRKPYSKDNNIEAEVASYHSLISKHSDECDISSASNYPIQRDIDSISKFINAEVNSTTKRELMNPYLTLNSSEVDKSQNYYTTVDPDMEIAIRKENHLFVKMKRHSCP